MRTRGCFPEFPFGSDFSPEELQLLPALKELRRVSASKVGLAAFLLRSLLPQGGPSEFERPLERLGLTKPENVQQWLLKQMVLRALRVAPRH